MDNPDIFANVIMPFCDIVSLLNLGQISRMHYLVARERTPYNEYLRQSKVFRAGLHKWRKANKGYKPGRYDMLTIIFKGKCVNILKEFRVFGGFKLPDKRMFNLACTYGNLEIMQWLYSLGGVDIHADDDYYDPLKPRYYIYDCRDKCEEYPFTITCANGKLDAAKWIYSFGGKPSSGVHNYAFLLACNNGKLEVAQWLYSLGFVNIHHQNDRAFKVAHENMKVNVMKWLYDFGNVNIYGLYYGDFTSHKWQGQLKYIECLSAIGADVRTYVNRTFVNVCFPLPPEILARLPKCTLGPLEVLTELLKYNPDIYSIGKEVFGWTLEDDCVQIVESMCADGTNTNIRIQYHPHRRSCTDERQEIIKWLFNLDPEGFIRELKLDTTEVAANVS